MGREGLRAPEAQKRKFFNTSPTWREALQNAKAAGLSPVDVEQLYGILGVSRPEVL